MEVLLFVAIFIFLKSIIFNEKNEEIFNNTLFKKEAIEDIAIIWSSVEEVTSCNKRELQRLNALCSLFFNVRKEKCKFFLYRLGGLK